jgi:branched-chain amino acid transport system substrate-binding protein
LQFDILSPEARELVTERPDASARMLHVDPIVSSPALAKFVLRHNEVFSHKITAFDASPAPYDAFYVAAYAAAALGGEPITGPALGRAILRLLPPGEPVDVGPAGIYRALAALADGKNIDLAGAVTSLDFDPETGDAPADFSVLCLSRVRDGGPPEPAEAGLVYRARTQKLEGRLHCP